MSTVNDLAGSIRAGEVSAANVPVQTITRQGQEYILNTRTGQALERADIPREQWNRVEMTGNQAAEQRLSGQLERSGLQPPEGCSNPTSTGCR